jgi:alkylation response protein AidB-like acyl-CoA dehydrogenase
LDIAQVAEIAAGRLFDPGQTVVSGVDGGEPRVPGAGSRPASMERGASRTPRACSPGHGAHAPGQPLGHAVAPYDTALTYAKRREQFSRPLCSFQIIQDRLVKMLAEVTAMQLYCLQIGRLPLRGQLSDTIAGLAKLNNSRKARQFCAEARDMLGGNGILLGFHAIRHMADVEAILAYEGTEAMQTLIVGRDITGVGAFA